MSRNRKCSFSYYTYGSYVYIIYLYAEMMNATIFCSPAVRSIRVYIARYAVVLFILLND